MKNNSLKRAFSALAIAAVAASASSMAAFADETNGFSQDQIDASEIKPTVFISVDGSDGGKVFDESIAGKEVECTLNVKGAEDKYASTGFHVFVSTLEIVDDGGDPLVEGGDATKKLAKDVPVYDKTIAGNNGFFAATAGSKDVGKDGVMWTFTVKVPSTAKAGDVFPIDIMYRSSDNAEDLFCSCDDTEASKLMQGYTFTRGIYNTTVNNNFAAAAADVEKCPALADIDKSVDAYIAIAGGETTTESTTTEATTTEATTTEATTTASATTSAASSTATGSTTSGSTTSGTGTTSKAATGTTKNPQTGVSGTGAALAVAGLAAAVATAFALRKKED